MPPASSSNAGRSIPLGPRMRLQPAGQWHMSAELAAPEAAVLGAEESYDATAALSIFAAAEPPIVLEASASPAAVLGEDEPQPAVLEYQPEEQAVYALMQAIETPDGTIYDFTL
ncbi:MAG: hypothetical protein H7Z42_04810, partial [Roseiflexaceae bacterium]|nr:hypothetical protein [Roseiflexaceae bacterium]